MDREIDRARVDAAKDILRGPSSKVYKSTRSGFTTSAVIAAQELGMSILVISPTNRILNDTIQAASEGRSVSIPANISCLKIQEDLQSDKFLAQIPLPLPSCKDCEMYQNCPVTHILRIIHPVKVIAPEKRRDKCLITENSSNYSEVISVTYQKLVTLMLSKAKTAKKILRILSSINVILLDEAHTIALPAVVAVRAFTEIEIPKGFPALSKVNSKWLDFNRKKELDIKELAEEGNRGHVGRHLSKNVHINDTLSFKQLVAAWNELLNLAKRRKELGIEDSQILALRDIISLLSGHFLALTYRKEKEDSGGSVYFAGNYWIAHRVLSEFLTKYGSHATQLYVSGTLVEPHPNYYSELSGKIVRDVIFPDIRNTNKMMMINSDKWRLDSHNFTEKLEEIVDRIVEIFSVHRDAGVYVMAPNALKAKIIRDMLKQKLRSNVPYVDYYRSDGTIGVSRTERVCIAIGLAELPSNTYDHLALGDSSDERWINSQKLRLESMQAATMQAWSRVKDPEGKDESLVYCIGVRADQIRDVVSWGPGRKLELVEIKSWKLPQGIAGRTPVFRVTVKDLIEPPMISAELKTSARRDRHNAGEYVERVQNYDGNLIISEFVDKFPIFNNRGNVHKLGIYNNPPDKDALWSTSLSLTSLLATRFDCYAIQNNTPDKKGKCGYSRHRANFLENPYLMEYHVKGQFTLGFYQIGLDNKVKWICFDIDDHEGKRGPDAVRADLHKLFDVLTKYGIPFLLEASGSPNSYHIWILLRPTKTYNAYIFSKQIVAEAGIKCEIFPKQRALYKKSKFGNLVKVPIGINRKTGIRSQFLDPVTFEPYPGLVPIPGIVQLREVPEPEERHAKSKKCRAKMSNSGQERSTRAPTKIGQDLRQCLKEVLAAKIPLVGSEGNDMRVAIAAEARNVGYTIEQTIELFKDQPDFNLDITRNYIEYIYANGYLPYSCNTLRGKCNSLISPRCVKCPKNE